ncbi:uncharacterized protein I303_104183 [Kwoniella dejecticola CBS 10117]|uniref:Uncharacterized protein n=1 Tax=Kwoniella dejecticola CBS 10117 TaxID=1296121 RepID=A0A1A6A617_9TREE|nr:uncharacterized protein I303_04839 [Kwoniella dejecticola CBS 10117]OBR85503.1 hypothetical protein I303_04839 [Kwoniella dejecticola CBS 10117]
MSTQNDCAGTSSLDETATSTRVVDQIPSRDLGIMTNDLLLHTRNDEGSLRALLTASTQGEDGTVQSIVCRVSEMSARYKRLYGFTSIGQSLAEELVHEAISKIPKDKTKGKKSHHQTSKVSKSPTNQSSSSSTFPERPASALRNLRTLMPREPSISNSASGSADSIRIPSARSRSVYVYEPLALP